MNSVGMNSVVSGFPSSVWPEQQSSRGAGRSSLKLFPTEMWLEITSYLKDEVPIERRTLQHLSQMDRGLRCVLSERLAGIDDRSRTLATRNLSSILRRLILQGKHPDRLLVQLRDPGGGPSGDMRIFHWEPPALPGPDDPLGDRSCYRTMILKAEHGQYPTDILQTMNSPHFRPLLDSCKSMETLVLDFTKDAPTTFFPDPDFCSGLGFDTVVIRADGRHFTVPHVRAGLVQNLGRELHLHYEGELDPIPSHYWNRLCDSASNMAAALTFSKDTTLYITTAQSARLARVDARRIRETIYYGIVEGLSDVLPFSMESRAPASIMLETLQVLPRIKFSLAVTADDQATCQCDPLSTEELPPDGDSYKLEQLTLPQLAQVVWSDYLFGSPQSCATVSTFIERYGDKTKSYNLETENLLQTALNATLSDDGDDISSLDDHLGSRSSLSSTLGRRLES